MAQPALPADGRSGRARPRRQADRDPLALWDPAMMELRPNCECCDRDLPPASQDAFICTYECTFCEKCVRDVLQGTCPNCGGNFERRPVRTTDRLVRHPPSQQRTVRKDCSNPG